MIVKTPGYFECTALFRCGSMREVYWANNQKLGRDVAINGYDSDTALQERTIVGDRNSEKET